MITPDASAPRRHGGQPARHTPHAPRNLLLCAAALALAGCGSNDVGSPDAADAAFKGQVVDGALAPVASRPVMVGGGGPRANACASAGMAKQGSLTVYWSNSDAGPAKGAVDGAVWMCATDGAWTGIIYPAAGQSADECLVSAPVAQPREYQGPCRWGWAKTAAIGQPRA
ncbi:MAG: hypothetical protein ACKOUM_06555 [Sphingopyxis sp.]